MYIKNIYYCSREIHFFKKNEVNSNKVAIFAQFMETWQVIALIISGLLVGFINTLAGGGTIISLSLLMFFGLPADVANGTNRVAVTIQTLTSTLTFSNKKVLDFSKGLQFGIPVAVGSLIGSLVAIKLHADVIKIAIGVVMLLMLFFMIIKPEKWLKGNPVLNEKKPRFIEYFVYVLIGLYGGFIHAGVGYFMLAMLVLVSGFDLLKANAIKVFMVFLYVPLTLLVFALVGKVHWQYGFVHAIGNVAGAWIGARWAVKYGTGFVRWIVMAFILFTVTDLFGLIDIRTMFMQILQR